MSKESQLISEVKGYKLREGHMAFWWLGQLGYIVRMADLTIYADPYLSASDDRLFAPPLQADEIDNADIVLGSHDHLDHIDDDTWKAIAKASPQAVFVLPKLLMEKVSARTGIPKERMTGLDDGDCVTIKGVTIKAVAAAHEFLDPDPVTGEHPYLGYVVEGGGRVFYHAGDTCLYEGLITKLKKLAPPDVMFVPINGRDARRLKAGCIGNMTFQEAVDLCGQLSPGLAVPGHFDMFSDNLGSPLEFKAYLEIKYPEVKCWIGERGSAVEV